MGEVTPIVGRKRGNKPVDLVSASGYHKPQDAVWDAVRNLKQFTLADVMIWLVNQGLHALSQETAKSYLIRLTRGEYIKVIKRESARNHSVRHTYELVNDVGVHAPRLTKEGKASKQGLGRENLWRSMKILKTFDYRELAEVSSTDAVTVKPSESKDYVLRLHKAGYLHQVTPAKPRPGALARYTLKPSMNTGYHPPMIQRIKRVFDPNLNKVMGEDQ